MNKQEIEIFFDIKNDLEKRIEFIANLVRFGSSKDNWDLEEYEDYGNNIHARLYSHPSCGCCGPDYEAVEFPKEFLWTDNAEDKALAEYEENIGKKKRKEEELKTREKERIAIEKEKRDKKEYARLKEKFET